jgi:hypothetical protein
MAKKKKAKHLQPTEDFGSVRFFCKHCQCFFEIEWETIFDLQECTHGFVGYEYFMDETFPCADCGADAEVYQEPLELQLSLYDELPFK